MNLNLVCQQKLVVLHEMYGLSSTTAMHLTGKKKVLYRNPLLLLTSCVTGSPPRTSQTDPVPLDQ